MHAFAILWTTFPRSSPGLTLPLVSVYSIISFWNLWYYQIWCVLPRILTNKLQLKLKSFLLEFILSFLLSFLILYYWFYAVCRCIWYINIYCFSWLQMNIPYLRVSILAFSISFGRRGSRSLDNEDLAFCYSSANLINFFFIISFIFSICLFLLYIYLLIALLILTIPIILSILLGLHLYYSS